MEQKLFKTVNAAGISAIVTGVVMLAAGLACVVSGILSLVHGGKLLGARKGITF